uniref:Antitoxin component of toxin-antitoxin stability system, DNA-binding transcriptional repressor n=1 Tax=Candidatus Kentrum sp. DK TaxID=2126562 RepID=A0A450TFI4_9GAMM|nr:MAG: Antitoxin component of toxin-antitoxin stability system, DNA-binding transcriptional repressor [Candidatus Kentron sp. DK]
METFNMHEAKTYLSRLVENAVRGEPLSAKAGNPLVKVTALDAFASTRQKRVGFMAGQFEIPDDFDTMGQGDIEKMFGGAA